MTSDIEVLTPPPKKKYIKLDFVLMILLYIDYLKFKS